MHSLCNSIRSIVEEAIEGKQRFSITLLIDCANFLETTSNIEDFENALRSFRTLIRCARDSKNGSNVRVILFFPDRSSRMAGKMASRDGLLELTSSVIEHYRRCEPVDSVDDLDRLWHTK